MSERVTSEKKRPNVIRRGKPSRRWTPEEKATMLAFWPSIKTKGVCAMLNRTRASVQAMAEKMGLTHTIRPIPRALYHCVLEQEAKAAGVDMQVVLSKRRTPAPCAVRFRAWRRLRNEGREISAIARVAGKDFSAILNGLRRVA